MRSIREAIQKKRAAGPSMGLRLLLYWFTMVLLLMAAILSTLMATGVLSHPAHQLSGTLDIQQRNTYAALDSQMDALTAQSMAMSEKLGKELDAFLAAKGIAFDELNNDPDTIAELEKCLYTPLSNTLGAASCSGIFFGLNVTANTSLPNAEDFRAGLYLRYSGLQPTVASEQDVICFRGAAETARSLQLQMHNRWNPELNAALIPGSDQVTAYQGARLADGCLWTKRTELLDTWEQVMLLCVPILDGGGTVRGFCGAEISDLYFSLSHNTVPSAFGNMLTLAAPIDGDSLLLSGAMLGATDGSRLTANGILHISDGKYYTTYSDGKNTYLGRHQLLDAATWDGIPLAAVTLVPDGTFRSYEKGSQIAWFLGAVLFLLAMLVVATVLSRQFVKPINKSLAAVRGGTEMVASGIPEIDELLAAIRDRPTGTLPPDVEARLWGFAERASTLTGTERTILQYYMDGYTVKDIPELACISARVARSDPVRTDRGYCVAAVDNSDKGIVPLLHTVCGDKRVCGAAVRVARCRIAAVDGENQLAVKGVVFRIGLYERAAPVRDEDIVALLRFGISAEEIEKAELRELRLGALNKIFILCVNIDAAVFYLIVDDQFKRDVVLFVFLAVRRRGVRRQNISYAEAVVGKSALGVLERYAVILSVELIERIPLDNLRGRRCGAGIFRRRERRPELFAAALREVRNADRIGALIEKQLDKTGFADLLKLSLVAYGVKQCRLRRIRLSGRALCFRHGNRVGARAQGAEHRRRKQQSRYPRRYFFVPAF